MKIAIIGSGNVGGALAQALRRAGHEIVFGVKAPAAGSVDETSVAEAARLAEAAILAVPFAAAGDVIAAASGFAGKILIDATNPIAMGEDGLGLALGSDTSGAERIQAMAPEAHIFKAFNQTGFENMADARPYSPRPVMFVAGDDEGTKPAVLALVGDAGFEAVDLGGLRGARLVEPLAMLWIELARKRGFGREFAFALQRKGSVR